MVVYIVSIFEYWLNILSILIEPHLSMCRSKMHHQLGVVVETGAAEATLLGGQGDAELAVGRKNN